MLEAIIYIADMVLILVSIVMTRQIYRAFRYHRPPKYTSKLALETDLPSVSVCIPARNEQHALTDCLQRVLKSTYPKLEIIVLDDASADETPALINSFASEGIRFVRGKEPEDGWLGKNYAHQQLLTEASGSYILFLDVDTVLAPDAIDNMVRYSLANRATMISVLPRREDNWRLSVIGSPLRYFWEIIFNRRFSPATASSAWLIRREVLLNKFNGFNSMKNTIQPESKIAATLANDKEYKFLVGTKEFGVGYEKKWSSQFATGVRIVYPILGKQYALAMVAIIDMAVFLVPFIVLATFALWPETHTELIIVNLLLCMIYCGLYGFYAKRAWNKGWILGALFWPLLLIQEIVIVIVSTVKYSRKTITWRGRPILPEVQN